MSMNGGLFANTFSIGVALNKVMPTGLRQQITTLNVIGIETMKEYEVWVDSESVTLATVEGIKWQKEKDLLGGDAKLLHKFSAATPEEASAIHHLRMGFEPYKPMGEPVLCPKGCEAYFYPQGSGVCPNCGDIC